MLEKIKYMTDFQGKELVVGDKVIYIHITGGSSKILNSGIINEIKKVAGKDTAYIDTQMYKGVTSQNIYKV